MNKAAFSMWVFGWYLLGSGSLLALWPDFVLTLVGIPSGGVWSRFVAMIVVVIGAYYLVASRHNLVPFFRATVWGRSAMLAFGLVVVGLEMMPPRFLGMLTLDFAGAVWTAIALGLHREIWPKAPHQQGAG